MPIISAVGVFCCDKFEETSNKKVSNMSKLTKSYFSPVSRHRDKLDNFTNKNNYDLLTYRVRNIFCHPLLNISYVRSGAKKKCQNSDENFI